MAVFDNLNRSTDARIAPEITQYYTRTLLENMKPELVHIRDAQKRPLPMHNGKRVQFRRFTPFAAVTEPLAEGITPTGQNLEVTEFTAMVKPYGRHVEITDELNFYTLDNMHQETAQLLSDQANLTLDTVASNALNAGMNVQYVGSNSARSTIAASDKLTYAEIKKAVRTLKRKNVKPFPDGFYHAIVHPDVVHDLTSDSMWTDITKYQDKTKVEKYELGTCYKVKFYESTNAKKFTVETYLFGTTTNLAASASYDTTAKKMTVTTSAITQDIARELTGKLVMLQYTKSATNYTTPACIERVVPGTSTAEIYFRWNPTAAFAAELTTAQSAKIVPTGAGASNVDVYSTLIYGQNAFGCVELGGNGGNVQVIIKAPGSSGAEDPLDQRGTIAWKVKGFCCVILQDDFIVRVESGATA